MKDDIFEQLANLVNNKPDHSASGSLTSTGFGAVSFGEATGTSSDNIFYNDEMFKSDDMVVPDIKPHKSTLGKKRVVVIDDDFSTIDLMKIYLQRDYEYVSFDNPKNAIFYLNGNVPDLIFMDCYLNVMNSKRVVDIIRTYKELHNVPIIYIAESAEVSAVSSKMPEGVRDIITRPVKRGDLQGIIDQYLTEDEDTSYEEEKPIDHPVM